MTDGKRPTQPVDRLRRWLAAPVDAASLGLLRALLGLALAAGMLRFVAEGWHDALIAAPRFAFQYGLVEAWWGALARPDAQTAELAYLSLAGLALLVGVGWWARPAAALFCLLFSWLELLDVTNYLNHYVLVSLLTALLALLPSDRACSLRAWWARRRGQPWPTTIPRAALIAVQVQVALVYVFAALAKLQPDWLVHGWPLHGWLTARVDTPLVGPWLGRHDVALVASWAGFLFDLTIVGWLSWRRTRPVAYLAVLGFHAMTHVWFNIGMFPVLMPIAATVFFAPDWPRRWLGSAARRGRIPTSPPTAEAALPGPLGWLPTAALTAFIALLVLVPLRHLAYPGDVLWNEDGMRWAWKVMVREKHGAVMFRVRFGPDSPHAGKERLVAPARYLDARQEREMAGQPDLIAQLARHIARDFAARGHGDVAVYADTRVSLNGRKARPLIDPAVDLARVPGGPGSSVWAMATPSTWVLPGPTEPPPRLDRRPALADGGHR